MSLGVTYTAIPIKNAGGHRFRVAELTYDATYAGGGYALTAAALGLKAIEYVSDGAVSGAGDTGFVAQFDKANSKMKILKAGTADAPFNEADTNQADLTTLKSHHWVVGY